MPKIEINKTFLNKHQETAILSKGQSEFIKTNDGFKIGYNSKGEIEVVSGPHKMRIDLMQRIVDVKDLGLEIKTRK